jgi:hypothetical protein
VKIPKLLTFAVWQRVSSLFLKLLKKTQKIQKKQYHAAIAQAVTIVKVGIFKQRR